MNFFSKSLLSLVVGVSILQSAQAATLSISQLPLFLTEGVAPNIMVTLDNSGSMRWAFTPDALSPSGTNTYLGATRDTIRTSRRAKSVSYNPSYYDPNVTYTAPYSVTYSNGTLSMTPIATSFTAAYVNGFKTSKGSVDLSSSYRVSWNYDTGTAASGHQSYTQTSSYTTTGTVYHLAANPASDFSVTATISSNNGTSTKTTTSGVDITIKRTSASACSASATGFSNISCTGTNGSFTASLATVAVPAYYYVYDASISGCTNSTNDDNCYRYVKVTSTSGVDGTDERQNFANWYSFYRNRALATQAAANLAMVSLSENTRVAWQGLGGCVINSTSCAGLDKSTHDSRLRNFSGQHKANFFAWLADINYDQSTPLRGALVRVGDFLQSTGVNSPYAYSLGSTEAPRYACRPSYHIMMTDGVWNGDSNNYGDVDSTARTLPDGQTYTPMAPFKDSTSHTLADLAFKYWATDAQPNLANEVPTYIKETSASATTQYWNPKNDPATWQHLTNFFVGLGLSNSLTSPAWGGDTYSGDYSKLKDGSLAWPAAATDSQNNVYDLWHAALNSRGEFFSVDSPGDLVSALEQVVNRISERTAVAAAPAVTSPLLDSDSSSTYETYTYTPEFSSEDWSGDLIKSQENTATGTSTQIWSAKSQLNNRYTTNNTGYSSRKVKIANSTGSALQDFTWANLSAEQKTALNKTLAGTTDSNGEKRVAYIRGDRSNEGTLFRSRTNILGDIINSSPAFVRKPTRLASIMNAAEGQSAGASNSYTQFRSEQSTRASIIYVGANDGMLHAFEEETGQELFAFIPKTALTNIYKLTDTDYTGNAHQYYVDGSPIEADVFFDNKWRSVVIGTMRGGGREIFALDVTDPNNISLLWEITPATEGYEELGYTFSRPAVTRLNNGKWAVVVGNGYSGAADKGVLYLIDVQNGNLIKSFTVDDGKTTANGLSTPYVADIDGDLNTDYVYAGDLHGNMWRFDLIGDSISNYATAFGGKPLFTATTSNNQSQPITSRPYLAKHPNGTGYIVVFGTGKYIENDDADPNTEKVMSLYGIWDKQANGSTASSTPSVSRSSLQAQTITEEVTATFDNDGNSISATIRTVSNNKISWSAGDGTVDKYGWYMDLPATGEMVVNSPYISDDILVASTLTPNDDPCADGVTTWLMVLNPFTGGATTDAALDLNNDGVIDSSDQYNDSSVAGVKMDGLTGGFAITRNSKGNLVVCGAEGCKTLQGATSQSGRQSWRIIQEEE